MPPPPTVTKTFQKATINILPPPRANISLPNAFFMPPPPHQFQTSSPYTRLHINSSSVPSTSSTPSLSGLRIKGSSISTSPSIDSATTTTSQFLKFKEVVEYNGNNRLIIAPDGGNRLNYFEDKFAWNSCHENEIQRIIKFKAALRIKEHLYEAQRSLKKPGWLNVDVWVKFLEKWDTPEFRVRRERAKANRVSQMGGSLHTGGSMSFTTHRRKLVILA
ncbi:hypothetical protein FXO38_34726 [Capsicum annuum]|nr:hypothetical protein FXO38_34726 [Capsicum annuum]